jgi:hypothetical protein
MGTHGSYLISMGQIQPTKITFISMSFNSSSQKYANFCVHTYHRWKLSLFIPTAQTPFNLKHMQLLAPPPPALSSHRRPSAPRVPVELATHPLVPHPTAPTPTDGPTHPTAPLTAPPTRPVPQLMALLARSMPQPMASPARVVPHRSSSASPPPPKCPRRLSVSTEQCRPPAPRWPPLSNAALLLLVCRWPP